MFKANTFHDKDLCDLLIEPHDMRNYEIFDATKGREIFELGYQTAKTIIQRKLDA
jgi:NTE family protein